MLSSALNFVMFDQRDDLCTSATGSSIATGRNKGSWLGSCSAPDVAEVCASPSHGTGGCVSFYGEVGHLCFEVRKSAPELSLVGPKLVKNSHNFFDS